MSERLSYFSTNFEAPLVNFEEALLKGLAPDKGLYMPSNIPTFTEDEIKDLYGKKYTEVAFAIFQKFLSSEIPEDKLKALVEDAYNYDVPLEHVYDRNYVMRLDQGPTASFKDFAARMMGRLMNYFLQKQNRKLLILTATSGDTGSAIASAFYGLERIKVVILYPQTEVTDRQRKQMTTLKQNIQVIAIDGKFDDCQALVKMAFSDKDLDALPLSSANSINIGRLLPQSVYYAFAALSHSKGPDDEATFCVPSGNFGNVMGGLIAKKMGFPIKKFVIATNENDEVPVYYNTGNYEIIAPSKNCISSAMNVGHPSNMSRIVTLYGGMMNEKGVFSKPLDEEQFKGDVYAVSVTDQVTKDTIKKAYDEHKLLLEPHGAVGWYGIHEYFKSLEDAKNELTFTLETAHPAKFPVQIQEILNLDPDLPKSLEGLEDKEESFDKLGKEYDQFKNYLKTNYA